MNNSDALTFLLKEFKSDLHPERIKTIPNPLLVSKLDIPVTYFINPTIIANGKI